MQKKIRYDGFIAEYEDSCICDLTPRDIDLNLELMNTKPPED